MLKQPPQNLRMLRDFLHIIVPEAASHIGQLELPETARHAPSEARVRAAGPDCTFVAPGDRVLYEKWQASKCGWLARGEGIVAERHVILAIKPDNEVVMAPGWALILPDPTWAEQYSAGGIVIADGRQTAGAEFREKRRSVELFREFQALKRSQKYREQPTTYDRHLMVKDFVWELKPNERILLGNAIKENGNITPEDELPMAVRRRKVSGFLVRIHEGSRPHTLEDGRDWQETRVHWTYGVPTHEVRIGEDWLLAVQTEHLAAVESTDGDA